MEEGRVWHNLWPARSSDNKSHIILKDGGGVLFALKSKIKQNKKKKHLSSQRKSRIRGSEKPAPRQPESLQLRRDAASI